MPLPTRGAAAPIPALLYWHLVATTLLHCLVVVGALALDAIAPWAAAALLAGALTQAAHAAHVRRDAPRGGPSEPTEQ